MRTALATAGLLLAFAALTGDAVAKPHARGGKITTYKGGSKNDRGAKLLVKAQSTRSGIPRKVTLIKVVGGTMQCFLGPTNETTPVELNWAFREYAVPVALQTNNRNRKVRAFEAVQTNGGAPTEGEEEEFTILGRFALNGKRANVNVDRQFVTEGSAVGSSEEFVTCNYHALFHVKQLGARGKR